MITYRLLKCVHDALVDAAPDGPDPVARQSTSPARPWASYRCRLRFTVRAVTFLASGSQFGGLRFLPLCQRVDCWIILRPATRTLARYPDRCL